MTEHPQPSCITSVRRILEAANFASEKHAGQKRKGHAGEPYVNHLIEVAALIAAGADQLDEDLIMAGLLHDIVEDTDVTADDLEERFGQDVTRLVLDATDDKCLSKEKRKALQVESAPYKSPRAQVLKLADKISNIRALISSPPAEWSRERKREYAKWAARVVAGFSAPNQVLKSEFEKAYSELMRNTE